MLRLLPSIQVLSEHIMGCRVLVFAGSADAGGHSAVKQWMGTSLLVF